MTVDEIIEGVLLREGPGNPAKGYLSPGDKGGRTNWGISERSHPEEWANGKVPSRERAAEIYRDVYVLPFSRVWSDPLKAQLVDWCVLHGEGRTWRWLGRLMVYLNTETGRRAMIDHANATWAADLTNARFLNNALVAARLKLIDEISDADVKQKVNEEGWENRALSFLLLD